MSLYDVVYPQVPKMLENLSKWLDKAEAHAKEEGRDPNGYASGRLFPDMYTLTRQVQAACDAAKLLVARLADQKAPVHDDPDPQTLDELRARIADVLAYVRSTGRERFEGADSRHVSLSFAPGRVVSGREYLHEMALPNFYFHVTIAYAILRHAGVPLGKLDYIGPLPLREA